MHKRLLLLGLLLRGPQSGYQLHRIVAAHGDLYADLKKGNIYYVLERLADEGLVKTKVESGTRGRRGERVIYRLTAAGRREFERLLRDVLTTFEPTHSGLDVAISFLANLPRPEARQLLTARRKAVARRRDFTAEQLAQVASQSEFGQLAAAHLLGTIDAELTWLDQALSQLSSKPRGHKNQSEPHAS
jgi:DNA-binding PadR family transcriptional regulator